MFEIYALLAILCESVIKQSLMTKVTLNKLHYCQNKLICTELTENVALGYLTKQLKNKYNVKGSRQSIKKSLILTNRMMLLIIKC